MRGIYKYQIEEKYKGKTITVRATEWWNEDIKRVGLLCLENESGVVPLGHKKDNPISLGHSIMQPIASELTISEVDKGIIEELKKAEQLFDKEKGINYELEHYDFEKRFLKLTYEYRRELMTLNLYINFVDGNVYFIDENEDIIGISALENDEYRNFIHSYICYFQQVVDYNIREGIKDYDAFFAKLDNIGSFRMALGTIGLSFMYCITGRSEEECYKAICGRQKVIQSNHDNLKR